MLAAIEALEVIPRVQIQRVQQNMTIVILEFWLIIRTEVDSAKKFTQSICNNFVLTFDGMGGENGAFPPTRTVQSIHF